MGILEALLIPGMMDGPRKMREMASEMEVDDLDDAISIIDESAMRGQLLGTLVSIAPTIAAAVAFCTTETPASFGILGVTALMVVVNVIKK